MSTEKILEIYGVSSEASDKELVTAFKNEKCPYLSRKCLKNRKSEAEKTIGTCSVLHKDKSVIICPHRLLENHQIFTDCIHLLTLHQPGNQLHLIPEVAIPGGNVDYFLASALKGKIKDFVGIELQTLDSTGTIWPARQDLAFRKGAANVKKIDVPAKKAFGMNWKMTAKTILVQLHHKLATFEHLNKHLVLVLQDQLLSYMKENFDFSSFTSARVGDSMHLHAYSLDKTSKRYEIQLGDRVSTDAQGIEQCLGLQQTAKVELANILMQLESKISKNTLVKL